MGRPEKSIDMDLVLDLLAEGIPKREVAEALNVSPMTIDNRIRNLRKNESALLAYDKSHYLDLIRVKERLIAGMTDDKIAEAPLGQIAMAYGTVGKMEQLIQGRPTEIHGLMGYLMKIEQEDIKAKEIEPAEDAVIIDEYEQTSLDFGV